MSEEYEPLEIDLNTTGNVDGISAILQSTIEGIKNLKGQIHLVMKLREKV